MNSNLSHTDKELFTRISRGDEVAFAEIYLRYTEKLYPHVTRLLDSDLWAEEIVQDVFTKLWQVRQSLSSVENPSAYLYRMAGNRTLDHLKHHAIEVKMQYHMVREAEYLWNNSLEEHHDSRISGIKRAVEQLTAQKQLIFRLKHVEGLTYEEIAHKLQLSKNTVRNHLTEALHFIRTYLFKKGVFILLYLYYYLYYYLNCPKK
ncbi:hypothetical protein A3860_05185 [Niastella vici]|uniref:HTH luxR-type domain-containing protein n=1 Tax=Niastella vici TaxID=1703345 RepID=A0A1V9FRZ7_9BACT|nr:RNA polymerase sigma-70 factor [Niastella vici]OQP61113.1 hypothetical protein A3860_05185 [Niastella vici]